MPGIYRHCDATAATFPIRSQSSTRISRWRIFPWRWLAALVIRDSVGEGSPRFLDGCHHGDQYEDCGERNDNHKVHTENELPHTGVLSGKYSKWDFVCALIFVCALDHFSIRYVLQHRYSIVNWCADWFAQFIANLHVRDKIFIYYTCPPNFLTNFASIKTNQIL